ncbi:MAG: aminotransferase class V-fold PLP-dependent enzyme [Polyangiales bacterium]
MDAGDPLPALGSRALFPELRPAAYLAHAAVSPPSTLVRRAVERHLAAMAGDGALAFGAAVEQRRRLRDALAQLLHARPEEVAISPNTSTGVSDVALSFPWSRGDRAVVFAGEFPANVTPWQRAAELFGVELVAQDADRFRTDPTRAFEDLDAALARGARLVAVSQVQFQTGHRMPLRAIADRCHAHGAELFVDAIQGLGGTPIDVDADGVDYLAAGGHKWLMGLEGAGVLYVRAERAAALRPFPAGWLSHVDAFRFLVEGHGGHLRYDRPLRARADVFESGTFNAAGCFALEASVGALLALGVERIHAHANAYLDALEAGLVARGFESLRSADPAGRSCILGVRPPPGPHDVASLSRGLAARGVVTSTPDGALRFAPHWPNHADEVPAVLDALDDAMTSPP